MQLWVYKADMNLIWECAVFSNCKCSGQKSSPFYWGLKHYILCVLLERLHVFFSYFDRACMKAWIRTRGSQHLMMAGTWMSFSCTDEGPVGPDSPHDSISSPSNMGGSKLTTSSYVSPAGKDTLLKVLATRTTVTSQREQSVKFNLWEI